MQFKKEPEASDDFQAKILQRKNTEGSRELQNSLSALAALRIDVKKDHVFQELVDKGEE